MTAKVVELLVDAYPFGCKGDVIRLSPGRLRALDALAKRRNQPVIYKVHSGAGKDPAQS